MRQLFVLQGFAAASAIAMPTNVAGVLRCPDTSRRRPVIAAVSPWRSAGRESKWLMQKSRLGEGSSTLRGRTNQRAAHAKTAACVADNALQARAGSRARRRRGAEHSLGVLQQGRAPADGTKARK